MIKEQSQTFDFRFNLMGNDHSIEYKKLLNFFESEYNELWANINTIATWTRLYPDQILYLVNKSDDFVLSHNENNQILIASREKFRREQPFFKKLIAAFKNRIV